MRPLLTPGFAETSQVFGLSDYLLALRAHWLWVVCAAILGLSGAAVYVRFFPDTYVSQAIVRFNPPQVADRYVSANDSMQAEQRLFALTQMLTSSVTARKLIESQGLYPEIRRFRTVEDLVPRFQSNLTVKRVNLAGVDPRRALPSLHLSFRYSSPEKARRVLTLMVESIHEANRGYRGDQSNGTTEFLRMQAESVAERIVELEAQISELGLFDRTAGDHEWALKIQQLYSVENRLGHVQTSLRNLQKERADLLNEIADFESRLRRVQATVNAKTELPSMELQSLRRRENDARLAYERLLERYRPEYPLAAEAKVLVDEAAAQVERLEQRELETARQRARRELGARLDTLRTNLATVEKAMQDQRIEEANLTRKAAAIRVTTETSPDTNMDYLRLTREYEVMKEFHRGLVKKQQESNVGSEMERLGRGEAIELVEPPTLPTLASQPVWPLKMLFGSLGCALLAALGIGWKAARNPMVRREHHLELWPSLPLLADIPPALPAPAHSPVATGRGFRIRVRWNRSSWLGLLVLLALSGSSACSWRGGTSSDYQREAKAAEDRQELRKAMVLYRRALAKDARNGEAHDALARLELEIGEVDRAYSHLLRAAELKPDDFGLHLRLAELTYLIYTASSGRSQDNLLELESIAGKLAERWPKRSEGVIYRALAMQERHRTPEAIELLRSAARAIGPDPALLAQTASLLHQQGETGEAIRLLQQLVDGGTPYAPAYDLLYLQRMQAKDTDAAGAVLKAKWTRLANLDSGLQYAAHLHALHLEKALDEQLSAILVRCGKEPDSLARIGDFWLNRGVLARAERAYLDGLANGSQRSLYITRLAELDARQGRPAEARRRLDQAFQQSPHDPLLQAHLAAIDLQSGAEPARAKAQLELELILQRMPRSSFVRYHLGRAYLRLGDVVKAAQQFERCVRLDPNYAPGWLALAETDLEQGHLVHARNRVDRILSHAPRLPSALLLKSKIHALQGEFGKAGEVLDTVSTLGGPEWEVRLRRAELKLLSGSVREAAALLEMCVQERPEDPRALLLLARAEIADGKSQSALARLRPFAGRQDAPETLLSEFASLCLSSGDTQTARQVYRTLMERFPGKAIYRVGMADALALSGKSDEALTHYGAAQQAAPNELPAWLHAAALQSSLGRFAIARETYRKALTLAPGNALVQNNLAYVLARTGEQLDYALELAQQAEQLMPGNPEIQDTLVYIHARRGMRQQALSTVERMLARSRGPERDQLLLLHSQLGQGQLEAAARGMEEARDRALSTKGRHS